ncbi:unnamed protein product [Urochloa decumbens]|uniref:VWFA domain-containing protein n=1 Tax=Urochloa decumbens TaxID=240449 RepID=A0ABC8ZAK5_9POAL
MSFRDDEAPPENSSAGPKQPIRKVDRVRLVAYSNDKAPLEENRQQVLLEVVDTSSADERSGLDLVAVLDVSGSMANGGKLDKLKVAMKFVISKLGPMDRLSIVTFSSNADRQCPLRIMTVFAKEELKGIVEDKLSAGGSTSMRDGLKMGVDVLAQRQYSSGRVSSVILMSDGWEFPLPRSASMDVDVGDVAVYTFGFGEDHDAEVLGAIASKSQGGTFRYVRDDESLSAHFAKILAGLLSIVVQDLKLTLWEQPGHSKIERVEAGSYPQTLVGDTCSVNVSFGDIFSDEVRKVIVHLILPAVHREYRATSVVAQCCYRTTHGKTFYSPRGHLRCFIHRTSSASQGSVNPEVKEELDRICYVSKIEEANAMNDYDSAHGKLEEAQKFLDSKQPNRMVDILKNELQQLLRLKRWKDLLASLLASKMTHDRQRGGGLFATPLMSKYTEQANVFEKDPNKLPPSVTENVEEAQFVMKKRGPERSRRTPSWWVRLMVILCTVLSISVIVAGVAVFAAYMLIKPKMPYLVVSDAQLGLLQYDSQDSTIRSLQMLITILAENINSKADASFSGIDFTLEFHGAGVALLRAEQFMVARESSLTLQFNIVSEKQTLDPAGKQSMEESLKAGVVQFDLFTKARTRWKVGVFVRHQYWTHISCGLHFFFPGNGTVMPSDRDRCRSKSP